MPRSKPATRRRPCSRRSATATRTARSAAVAQVAVGDAEDVAEEQRLDPRRRGRRERQQGAEAEHRGDDDGDRGVAADPGDPRRQRDRERGDDDRRHRAEQQRGAGDRGEDQAREERVRERLGRVGEAVEDDPAAERAAGDAEQDDLGEGALHERFLQWLEHVSGGDGVGAGSRGRRRRESRRWRRRRSLPAPPRSSRTWSGGPQATWRLLMQRTRSQRARLLEVVGGDRRRPAPPPPARAISASRLSALGRSRPEKGSSSSSTPASWTSARAISTRWRWPPERRPKVCSASARRPTRSSASRRRLALAPARPPPPGQPRQRPHRRHVERRDRVVEPRALGLGHGRRRSRATRSVPASGGSSPSSARSSVVLPPPLGPSRASVCPRAGRSRRRRSPARRRSPRRAPRPRSAAAAGIPASRR